MRKRVPFAAVAVAALLPCTGALAADQAGADALQADFQSFLADIVAAMPVRFTPDAPIRVIVKGDAYLVELAPLVAVLEGAAGRQAELHLDGVALRLVPDPLDPDITAFEFHTAPSIQLLVDGHPVVDITFGSFRMGGRWSDSLDQVIAYSSRAEDMRVSVDALGFMLLPVGVASRLDTTVALIEAAGAMSPQPRGLWSLRSSVHAEGVVGAYQPVLPDAEPVVIQRYDTLDASTTLSGYPAAEWRDFVVAWLPALISAGASGEALDRDELVALVSSLPVPFDSLTATTAASDVLRQGVTIAREEQRLEIRNASLDALDLRFDDSATGIAFAGYPDLDPMFETVAAALMPERYSSSIALDGIPLGHAASELVDTIDAWIDQPGAAGDIFLRSLASRAQTLASSGSLRVSVGWPDAAFDLDAALAAGPVAVLGVAGTVDGSFRGMDAIGARLRALPVAELAAGVASGWALLQAFGQREETAEGLVIRYRLEIAPDGALSFNGQDFGPVLRMVEGFVAAFGAGFDAGFIPDQD